MLDINRDYYVSILILLEVPLQPENEQREYELSACFNPYFTGSTTSTSLVCTFGFAPV